LWLAEFIAKPAGNKKNPAEGSTIVLRVISLTVQCSQNYKIELKLL